MADVAVDPENKNPKELLGQGIRAYILQDFGAAVEVLGKASELLAAEHGDEHDALGEVYFYYGKALLGLAREEAQPLGDAVPKNASDSEEEDGDGNDSEENGEEDSKTEDGEAPENGGDAQADSDKAATNGSEATCGSVQEAGPSTSCGDPVDAAGEAENDEPTDLQVAWEVLELAKKIYKKNEDVNRKNLAETLIALGEVSLESENFESAINDIKEGLEIQKSLFGKDSRTIAETYYNLGVAYSTNSQIDEAIVSFRGSLEYLKNRIDVLEKLEDKKDEAEDEIKEIKDLMPDIEEKINDMKSYKEEVCRIKSSVIESLIDSPKVNEVKANEVVNRLEVRRKPKPTLEDSLKKLEK